MSPRLASGLALPVVGVGAVMTWRDFRAGRSRFWPSSGISPMSFDRADRPILFWTSTVFNLLVVAAALLILAALLFRTGDAQ